MYRKRIRIALIFLLSVELLAQDKPQKRVSPDTYARVPATIRSELKKRNCELPETKNWEGTLLNVVQGHFADAHQTDWAAICILPDGSTRALMLWGKAASCPPEIHSGWALNEHFPPGEAGSLYLRKAPPKDILAFREAFGEPNQTPVTHDGVEVGGDKASLIYYCENGKWLELQGND